MYIGILTSATAIRTEGERRLMTKLTLRRFEDMPILRLEITGKTENSERDSNYIGVGPLDAQAPFGTLPDGSPRLFTFSSFAANSPGNNRVIRKTDPDLSFPNFLQGIDAFDADREKPHADEHTGSVLSRPPRIAARHEPRRRQRCQAWPVALSAHERPAVGAKLAR